MNNIDLPQYFFISWEAQTDPEVIKEWIKHQRHALVYECIRLEKYYHVRVVARELNPELSEAKKEMCFIIEQYKDASQWKAYIDAMGKHEFFTFFRRSITGDNERIAIFPSGKGIIKPLTEAEAKIIDELQAKLEHNKDE